MTTSNITSTHSPVQNRQKTAQQAPAQTKQQAPELTPVQQQKAALKVSILESTQVSIAAHDQSLSLLLNTAIDKINELLAPELGEQAIQKTVDSGLDVNPEATAERIVSLSTAMFGAYKEQKPGEEELVVLQKFMDVIGSGIDQGFAEARDVLEGLKVLQGDIASNIDQTFSLVQDKISAFETMIKDLLTE